VPPTATPTETPTVTPTPTIPVIPPPPTATPTATPTQCLFGTIQGTVVDGSNADAPIAGASVVILGPGGPYNLTTNASGQFTLGSAPNGSYTINASATGYQGIATASAEVNCSTASVLLRLYTPPQQEPTPTPTNTPVPPTPTPHEPDATPTPLPPGPTPTPPLPPELPKTGEAPLSSPSSAEWLILGLLAMACAYLGWRGAAAR
jgi:hypothetical protein